MQVRTYINQSIYAEAKLIFFNPGELEKATKCTYVWVQPVRVWGLALLQLLILDATAFLQFVASRSGCWGFRLLVYIVLDAAAVERHGRTCLDAWDGFRLSTRIKIGTDG